VPSWTDFRLRIFHERSVNWSSSVMPEEDC
jgi:hypothetical protein